MTEHITLSNQAASEHGNCWKAAEGMKREAGQVNNQWVFEGAPDNKKYGIDLCFTHNFFIVSTRNSIKAELFSITFFAFIFYYPCGIINFDKNGSWREGGRMKHTTCNYRNPRKHNVVSKFLRDIRFFHWWYFLVLPLLYCPISLEHEHVLTALRGIIFAASCLGIAYYVNNQSDRIIDDNADKNALILTNNPSRRWVIACGLISVITTAAAFLSHTVIGSAVMISVLIGWIYSYIGRLKKYPFIGTLFNLFIFIPLLFFCYSGNYQPNRIYEIIAVFTAMMVQNQLIHEVMDQSEDRRGGIRTTYMVIGFPMTLALITTTGIVQLAVIVSIVQGYCQALIVIPFLLLTLLVPVSMHIFYKTGKDIKTIRMIQRILGFIGGSLIFFLIVLNSQPTIFTK